MQILLWHVPTDVEWAILASLWGGENAAADKLQETGTAHWYEPNTGATNETGLFFNNGFIITILFDRFDPILHTCF